MEAHSSTLNMVQWPKWRQTWLKYEDVTQFSERAQTYAFRVVDHEDDKKQNDGFKWKGK